ncbi:DNA helicase [Acidovorax phage ACP17]|uniref:DNA helicase n=1 Tax=Acidovorax phage ACP17 TaxID=2010329 RepID=A0A218M2W0_9CAUD|nr:DNA helicase [Acidovorax phage ACP17]ASD50383.1 DNA helicase [Acidovorax phage ACP17]
MADIRVHYVNELHCRIDCEKSIAYEIWDQVSFFVPGYKFSPKFKAGIWDGKIRLLNLRTGLVFKNLLPTIYAWATEAGYSMELVEKAKFRPQVDFDPTWLDRWAEYGTMEPMAHQREYIKEALTRNQCLALSPTSSGKSYIIYMCVRYLLENTEGKVLITVPSTSLVEQLYSDFEEYAVDWDVGAHVQKLYGGMDKVMKNRVVISTWQSIYKNPPKWFAPFTSYFCDEAHGADAKSISGIIDNLPTCPIRIGLTGTLDGTLIHELEMRGRFGSVVKKITTRQLMDLGLVAKLTINCHRIKYTREECEAMYASKDYEKEVDYVIGHEGRNDFIVDLAMKEKGNTLILFNFIERQGDLLHKKLQEAVAKEGRSVYYITGKMKTQERERIRKLMEQETGVVLLATYGVLSTGVSIKNLDHIIFAHPYKAKIKNLQSIGRGLRLRKGKTDARLSDIGDDFSYTPRTKEWTNHLMKHFVERLKVYKSEEFDYEIFDTVL